MNLNMMSKNGQSVHPTSIHHHHPYQQPHVRNTLAHFNNNLPNSSQAPQTTTVVHLSSKQGETHSRAKLPPRYNSRIHHQNHQNQNHNKNKNNNHNVYKKWIRYSPRVPSRHHHYSPPTSQSSNSATTTTTTTGYSHLQKLNKQQHQKQQQVANETSSSLLSLKSIQSNNHHSSFSVRSSISSSSGSSHSTDDEYRSSLTTRSSYNSSSSSNDSGLFSSIVNDDTDDLFLIDCIGSPIKESNEHDMNQKVNLKEEEELLYGDDKYAAADDDDDLVLYRSSFNYYDSNNSQENEHDTSHGDTQQLLNNCRNQVSFVDISSNTHYFKIYYLPESNHNNRRATLSSSTTTRSETVAILPFCVHYLHHVLTTTTNDDKNNLLLARRTMEPNLTAIQQHHHQLTTTSTRTTTTKEDDFLLKFIRNVISFLSESTSVDDRCFLIACMHIHDAFFSLTRKQQHQHHYEHHEQHNNQFFHINNFISIFCACLMLSAKFNEDEYMQNEEWCQLMPLFELKQCQKWRDTSLESVPRINSSSSNTRSLSFGRSLKALNSHEVWILQLLDYRLYKDRSHVHDFVCDHWNLISATQKSTFHLNEKTTTNKKKN